MLCLLVFTVVALLPPSSMVPLPLGGRLRRAIQCPKDKASESDIMPSPRGQPHPPQAVPLPQGEGKGKRSPFPKGKAEGSIASAEGAHGI